MRKFLVLIVLILFGLTSIAGAVVLTFDDIGTADLALISDSYGGLNWDSMAYRESTNEVSGYNNGIVSGDYVALNWYAQTATVSDGFFDFNGAFLTGAWNNGLNIEVTGFLSGTELYSQTVIVDTYSPTWFDFNFIGIDSLSFNSYGGVAAGYGIGSGTHFAMDNFTFNESAAPVPEPATLLLLGSGLAGLALYRRKRMK